MKFYKKHKITANINHRTKKYQRKIFASENKLNKILNEISRTAQILNDYVIPSVDKMFSDAVSKNSNYEFVFSAINKIASNVHLPSDVAEPYYGADVDFKYGYLEHVDSILLDYVDPADINDNNGHFYTVSCGLLDTDYVYTYVRDGIIGVIDKFVYAYCHTLASYMDQFSLETLITEPETASDNNDITEYELMLKDLNDAVKYLKNDTPKMLEVYSVLSELFDQAYIESMYIDWCKFIEDYS